MEYLAHTSEDRPDSPQRLLDHLQAVADMAREFGEPLGVGDMAYDGGLYHDVGKYSDRFQQYLRGTYKGKVDHSTAGAQLMIRNDLPLLAFCIAGHHAGLPNMGTDADEAGESTLLGRNKKEIEPYDAYKRELPEWPLMPSLEEMKSLMKDPLQFMMYIRGIFSCITDADFLDTEAYMSGGQVERGGFESIEVLADRFFEQLQKKGFLTPQNKLNEKRCEILQRCIEMGKEPSGLYTLTVPTGGGKTISSLAFAMEQVRAQKKRRIIYVIPYTSIIEQTADIFRDFLGDRNVLEHHMNAVYEDSKEDGSEQGNRKKLAAENWDAPVIVTTNVQFFESLFGNRPGKCRKLHNIAQSVIVFDEAQMLPTDFLRPVVQSIVGLVRQYGCSAVLCSATQPHLDRFFREQEMTCREIMEHIPELYQFFRRTRFVDEGLKDYEWAAEEIGRHDEVLLVAATKKAARAVYDGLAEKDGAYFLSTDLCPMHRRQVIREIKNRLQSGERCRVVSTSVISVGVDLDFPSVYMEMSGLDALIQGAGRCNREGKRSWKDSVVHVFGTEKGMQSSFMKQERQATGQVIQKHPEDMDSPEAIQMYFNLMYRIKEPGRQSSALDRKEILKLCGQFAFAEIGKSFRLIDEPTKSVFIPLDDEARAIEVELRRGIRNRALMRKAGQYIVAVRFSSSTTHPLAFEDLLNQGTIEMLDDELAVLVNPNAYDPVTGLRTDGDGGAGIII